MHYSDLRDVDRQNVAKLEVVWTYRTGELERRGPDFAKSQSFETTPILVGDSLILCSPAARVVALDPATGREKWVFDPNASATIRAPLPTCRGVSSWHDPDADPGLPCQTRIIFGTWDFHIYAIDAENGRPCLDFGNRGQVLPETDPGSAGQEIAFVSPPAILADLAIFGSTIFDNRRHDAPSGKVRAFDARSGELRWEFDPVPRSSRDPMAASWHEDSAKVTGAANVWAPIAADRDRGLLFLPTSSPSPDFFGGLRAGDNRYANSLVALEASAGTVRWHFQITHHDVWDYDLPAQPMLLTLPRDGERVPVVIQLTKQGLVFAFHRETGEPFFAVEERSVPQEGTPGEWLSPTQPFPVAPPPLVAQGIWPEDAWGFTPWDRAMCRKRIASLRHGPIYTPPSLEGTAHMPAFIGGANWGGGAYDPARNVLVVNTSNVPGVLRLLERDSAEAAARDRSNDRKVIYPQLGTPYSVEYELLASPLGAPCSAPPWGRLTAIDLSSAEVVWQVPLGSLEKLLPIPLALQLGTPNAGGPLVTASGLVFIAATLDDKFRAFDIDTGEILWEATLPAGGQSTPMTYVNRGRQHIVIAAGGHALYKTTPGDYVVAYALPN